MIKTINIEDCDRTVQQFFQMLGEQNNVVIYQEGKPCYFLGEIDNFSEEVAALSQNQELMDYLEQCRQRAKREGTISLAEIRQRLENT